LAPPNDQSDGPHTLPRPELNPLLNRLLADNMGRWAEVYFTAPPEKREEAVLELIRELEAENAGGERRSVEKPTGERPSNPQPSVVFPTAEYPSAPNLSSGGLSAQGQPLTHCPSCGHENPPSHQFCGMCGAKLERDLSRAAPNDAAVQGHRDVQNGRSDPPAGSNGAESSHRSDVAEPDRASERPLYEPKSNDDELALFRSISERNYSDYDLDGTSDQSPSRPYRVYIGIALAVILLALGYMAWRGSQATQSSAQVSAPPPAATTDTAAPATPPAPKVEQPAQTTPPPPNAGVASPTKSTDAGNKSEPSGRNIEAATKTPATDPTASNPPEPASRGNGNEELAIAQRYLNGGSGLSRNSAEAAQWLWKSVAKHNSAATLILADLYLKGDGVSKSCDQARVLLDSAARKGVSRAGERLRNLQAFGCQ